MIFDVFPGKQVVVENSLGWSAVCVYVIIQRWLGWCLNEMWKFLMNTYKEELEHSVSVERVATCLPFLCFVHSKVQESGKERDCLWWWQSWERWQGLGFVGHWHCAGSVWLFNFYVFKATHLGIYKLLHSTQLLNSTFYSCVWFPPFLQAHQLLLLPSSTWQAGEIPAWRGGKPECTQCRFCAKMSESMWQRWLSQRERTFRGAELLLGLSLSWNQCLVSN